jgi:hypothetical protein
MCQNCMSNKVVSDGLCRACDKQQKQKPLVSWLKNKEKCLKCKKRNSKIMDLCSICYHRRWNIEGIKKREKPTRCLICQSDATRLIRSRCLTCYQYRKRSGNDRDSKLYGTTIIKCKRRKPPNSSIECSNCKRSELSSITSGLCQPCYQFKRTHEMDRPAELEEKRLEHNSVN